MTFSADLSAYIKRTNKRASDVFAASCLQISEKVITRTPVRSGRARGNWNAEINRADGSTSGTRKENQALSDAASTAQQLQPGDSFYLTNGLPYIRALEYGLYSDGPKTVGGYSKQAPAGMLRITAEEFQQAVREAVNNVR